jgi:ceramide glucosyltransferase
MIPQSVNLALLMVIVAGWLYWLAAWYCVRRFASREPRRDGGDRPAVSILKPVKGLDPQAYENFASFCRQDYPEYELVFGASDCDDPAIAIVRQLQRDFPKVSIRLVVHPPEGANRKSAMLDRLVAQAAHDVLVISDSDIRVTEDYLGRVVAPLGDEGVGLVTCLYRSEAAISFTARLEALYLDTNFLPAVLLGNDVVGSRFALGATLALRREDLRRIGGYWAFVDYLTDDYQLGLRVVQAGLKLRLCSYVVANVIGQTTFREQWDREVRWARGIRVNRGVQYAALLLPLTVPLAGLLVLGTAGAPWAMAVLAVSLGQRWVTAWMMMRDLRHAKARRNLLWLPVRDGLSALIWCVGAVGRRVRWRGEEFVLLRDGRLQPCAAAVVPASGVVAAAARRIDAKLRERQKIIEFTVDEHCVLRLALSRLEHDVVLRDGTRLFPGETIGELHLWNEHVPAIPPQGPDLRWAAAMQRRVTESLGQLALHAQAHDELKRIRAFMAQTAFDGRNGNGKATATIERLGFQKARHERPMTLGRRVHDLGEDLLLWGLRRAYNPASRRGLYRQRERFWLTRQTLVGRYADGGTSSSDARGVSLIAVTLMKQHD